MRSTSGRSSARNILWHLTMAEGLERYLATRYPGAEALFARRRRQPDPAARRPDPVRRRARRRGHRLRHGAPRPAQRARQRARQVARGAVLGVRGQVRPQEAQGLGRRQVPHGLLVRRAHAGGQRARRARVQPVAPRDRQSGRRRLGARAPGAPRRRARRQGHAGADPRRRRVRRAGRRHGNAADVAGARVLHGRHDPRHHQQPGRLHDAAIRATRARRCTAATSPR